MRERAECRRRALEAEVGQHVAAHEGERQRLTSKILPPYMRRSPKVDEVLPILYLRGLSTGDVREAIPALLGEDAAELSAAANSSSLFGWEGQV